VKGGNTILSSYGTTIFEVMSGLAREHNSINLGQGFPDGNGPADVVAVAADYLKSGNNQYPPMMGTDELRQAVAAHNARFFGIDCDWRREVMVTSGGTEALTGTLLGLIEPGDEAVLIEPLYDSYLPMLRRAGATPKLVRLEPPRWELTREALQAAFSPRTKLILMNSPMNPCSKVFTRAELELIAEFCIANDAICVCDEVYEHLVYDGAQHIPMITLPGMRERTVRIESAGKIFSLTGWKVGFITACPEVLQPIVKAHQFLTFTTPPNLQKAVAYGLGKDKSYFADLAAGLQSKRDRLGRGLAAMGFDVLKCQGSYFITADFRPLGFNGDDADFCRHITTEAKVTAVPVSAFYQGDAPRHFARFAFCKDDATIDEALARLGKLFRRR
jgi:aspartate/methionine/tyrosine aminotransferase